jgi:anti-sigma B factor antagonist
VNGPESGQRAGRKGSIVQLLSIEQGGSIRLAGELDMSTAPQLREVLDASVEEGGTILVDLSELTFMDSTGINVFLRAAVSLRGRGCLVLHGEQDRVRRLLDLIRIDGSISNIHRVTHDVALASQNGSHPERSQTA